MRRTLLAIVGLAVAGAAGADGIRVRAREGQTLQQQEHDEDACYRWAKAQSGIDPMDVAELASNRAPRAARARGPGAARGGDGGSAADGEEGRKGTGDAADGEARPREARPVGAEDAPGGVGGRRATASRGGPAAIPAGDGYRQAFSVCMDARGYDVQ